MSRTKPTDRARATRANAWYRQPLLWLGVAVFVGSLGGCIWMVVLASQHPDVLTHVPTYSVRGMPLSAPASSRSTSP